MFDRSRPRRARDVIDAGSAGLGLLKKVMPDLQSTQISGDAENPLKSTIEIHIVDPKG
jgi:hypothetical protein